MGGKVWQGNVWIEEDVWEGCGEGQGGRRGRQGRVGSEVRLGRSWVGVVHREAVLLGRVPCSWWRPPHRWSRDTPMRNRPRLNLRKRRLRLNSKWLWLNPERQRLLCLE